MSTYSLREMMYLLIDYNKVDIFSKFNRWVNGKYVKLFGKVSLDPKKVNEGGYNTLRYALLDFLFVYQKLSIAFLLPIKEVYKDLVYIKKTTNTIQSEVEALSKTTHYYTLRFNIPNLDNEPVVFKRLEFRWDDNDGEVDIVGPAPLHFTVRETDENQRLQYLEFGINNLFEFLIEDFWFFDQFKRNVEWVKIGNISVSELHFKREYIKTEEDFVMDVDKSTNVYIKGVMFANIIPAVGFIALDKGLETVFYRYEINILVEFVNFCVAEFKNYNKCHPEIERYVINHKNIIQDKVRKLIDDFTHWGDLDDK